MGAHCSGVERIRLDRLVRDLGMYYRLNPHCAYVVSGLGNVFYVNYVPELHMRSTEFPIVELHLYYDPKLVFVRP